MSQVFTYTYYSARERSQVHMQDHVNKVKKNRDHILNIYLTQALKSEILLGVTDLVVHEASGFEVLAVARAFRGRLRGSAGGGEGHGGQQGHRGEETWSVNRNCELKTVALTS
jgi:hypothetical protein